MYPPNTPLPHLQSQRSRNRRSKHTHHTHTHGRRRTRMLRRTNARRTGRASILRTISRRTSTISLRTLQPLRTRIQQPLHHLKRIKHLAQIAVRGRVSLPPLLAGPRESALWIGARAIRSRGFSGRGQDLSDGVSDDGGGERGARKSACEDALEGALVRVAFAVEFAGGFDEDGGRVGQEGGCAVYEAFYGVGPVLRAGLG
jgi:hypothetical protein